MMETGHSSVHMHLHIEVRVIEFNIVALIVLLFEYVGFYCFIVFLLILISENELEVPCDLSSTILDIFF